VPIINDIIHLDVYIYRRINVQLFQEGAIGHVYVVNTKGPKSCRTSYNKYRIPVKVHLLLTLTWNVVLKTISS